MQWCTSSVSGQSLIFDWNLNFHHYCQNHFIFYCRFDKYFENCLFHHYYCFIFLQQFNFQNDSIMLLMPTCYICHLHLFCLSICQKNSWRGNKKFFQTINGIHDSADFVFKDVSVVKKCELKPVFIEKKIKSKQMKMIKLFLTIRAFKKKKWDSFSQFYTKTMTPTKSPRGIKYGKEQVRRWKIQYKMKENVKNIPVNRIDCVINIIIIEKISNLFS